MKTNPFPLLATLLAVSVCAWAAAPSATAAADQVQTATSPAREVRQRRMIFDNDGNEPHFLKALTAEDVLQQRTAALTGSQVDTLFYCTTDAFGITKRPSKVWQLFDSKAGTYQRNRTVELAAAGVDVLRVMVEFGHKNCMEVFANIRMNDVHDGGRAPDNLTRFKDNQFKAAHPDYLVGKKERQPRTGAWSAVNFALPEVREHLFRYLEESCREYNIDGLALDFFRHPCFFKSTFNGKPCTDAERAAMSELMQRVRGMMREVGAKRGRPLLLSVRVPDSAAYCRDIGLDVEHWLREGWLDLLVVTSYFQITDWSASVALGHKYGVPVYPSLDEARGKDASALALRSPCARRCSRIAAAPPQRGVQAWMVFCFSISRNLRLRIGDSSATRTPWPDWRKISSPPSSAKARPMAETCLTIVTSRSRRSTRISRDPWRRGSPRRRASASVSSPRTACTTHCGCDSLARWQPTPWRLPSTATGWLDCGPRAIGSKPG